MLLPLLRVLRSGSPIIIPTGSAGTEPRLFCEAPRALMIRFSEQNEQIPALSACIERPSTTSPRRGLRPIGGTGLDKLAAELRSWLEGGMVESAS